MSSSLKLSDYRTAVRLDELPQIRTDANWRQLLGTVLQQLGLSLPAGISSEKALRILHGVLAPINPRVLSDDLVAQIEAIAAGINSQRVSVDPLTLPNMATQYRSNYPAGTRTSIWVGDITQLRVDAIVNAANRELLGCRIPNHACIDNAIHSAAGPRLRDDCATIIERQEALEAVGNAKITRGYALPARYVLHTVGPQLRQGSQPTETQRQQLTSAYRSCLDLAANVEAIRSIAFCAISTGIFAYPKREAAHIALTTVADWFDAHPDRFERVVFNLYSTADAAVYEELLHGW